jgi:hypothetical protein
MVLWLWLMIVLVLRRTAHSSRISRACHRLRRRLLQRRRSGLQSARSRMCVFADRIWFCVGATHRCMWCRRSRRLCWCRGQGQGPSDGLLAARSKEKPRAHWRRRRPGCPLQASSGAVPCLQQDFRAPRSAGLRAESLSLWQSGGFAPQRRSGVRRPTTEIQGMRIYARGHLLDVIGKEGRYSLAERQILVCRH